VKPLVSERNERNRPENSYIAGDIASVQIESSHGGARLEHGDVAGDVAVAQVEVTQGGARLEDRDVPCRRCSVLMSYAMVQCDIIAFVQFTDRAKIYTCNFVALVQIQRGQGLACPENRNITCRQSMFLWDFVGCLCGWGGHIP